MQYVHVLDNVVTIPGYAQHFQEKYAGKLTLPFPDYLEWTHPDPSREYTRA